MKKLLKISLLLLSLAPAINASGFKRLGQKLSGFGRAKTPGILVASQVKSKAQVDTDLLKIVTPNSFLDNKISEQFGPSCVKHWDCQKKIDDQIDDYKARYSGILLKDKYPEFYTLWKAKQEEMGLGHVDIEFRIVEDLPISVSQGVFLVDMSKVVEQDKEPICFDFKFIIDINAKCFSSWLKNGRALISMTHELTHVRQILNQSLDLNALGMDHGVCVPWNKAMYEPNSITRRLMEQQADAAGFGSIDCSQCLFNDGASFRSTFDPAKLNEEGYCVSTEGYLSQKEILVYAEERQRDGQLCEMHAQNQ